MAETCCGDSSENPQGQEIDLKIRLDPDGKFLGVNVNGREIDVSPETSCCEPPITEPPLQTTPFPFDEARHSVFRLIRNAAVALFLIILGQFLLARWAGPAHAHLAERYGLWIFYLDVSVVALVSTLSYLRSYVYANAGHAVGMLIGMTIGMQVGTMVGGVLGATNGFFVGSMVGMVLGAFYGVLTAWCCGSMAVLHGLMGGVMGGPMGAMVVVMMLPDNVLIFMPFFTGINVLILMCFTYIFYRECVVEGRCPTRKPLGLPALLLATVLTTTGLAALVLFGPRGPMALDATESVIPESEGNENPFEAVEPQKGKSRRVPQMGCGAMMMEHEKK
ncbi:MAG: hypothetical protein RLZZ627_1865 [Pseudomonadota bacterium]|jgi:hypothetical protein